MCGFEEDEEDQGVEVSYSLIFVDIQLYFIQYERVSDYCFSSLGAYGNIGTTKSMSILVNFLVL